MSKTLYSVVVPVYKSEATLRELYERVDKTFEGIEGDYELILVEDCGGDGSWEVMKSLRQMSKKVRIVQLAKNFGQHNAVMCGFSFAKGDYVITIDDDLQNPPEEIPKLIEAVKQADLDVVYGIPQQKQHSILRNWASRVFGWFVSLAYRRVPKLKISNVQIIARPVVEQVLECRTHHPVVPLLVLEVTEKIGTVAVEHRERAHGETTYSKRKLIEHFTYGILYHSALPLKGLFVLGVGCFCLSCVLGLFYLILFLGGVITVSGWTTLVLLILFFSGITMFSLGIVGEYLFRIIQQMQRPPQYIIRNQDV